jgi:hypothetical protein
LWDHEANGFALSHQVSLWDAGSNPLAPTTFSNGAAGTLGADGFRYLSLAIPLFLAEDGEDGGQVLSFACPHASYRTSGSYHSVARLAPQLPEQ